jgi:hypothetical protein
MIKRVVVTVLLAAGILLAPASANADPYPYNHCYHVNPITTTFAYHDVFNNIDVYASGWRTKLEAFNADSNCRDINVKIATSGAFVVRIVGCQNPNPCVAAGWGAVTPFTNNCGCGVALNWWQMPSDFTGYVFRFETTTAKQIEGIW